MKKSELDALDLSEWMNNHWNLYASQIYREKRLLLWTNGQGCYRVIYGDETLYEGFQVECAVAAWNAA